MLQIKNITAKNFLSIGNNTQSVDFTKCKLCLVLGQNLDMGEGSRNGVGKTAMLHALSFALYGKSLTNIGLNNLVNKSNQKSMIVTVDFDSRGQEYKITRGRSPSILKFEKNGLKEQQGENKETQKEIDKILGFPYLMFKHLVALNTYVEPFLSLGGPKQREMIEQLLGITDLSTKAAVLNENFKATKDLIKQEEFKIETIKRNNQRIESNIINMDNKNIMWQKKS